MNTQNNNNNKNTKTAPADDTKFWNDIKLKTIIGCFCQKLQLFEKLLEIDTFISANKQAFR